MAIGVLGKPHGVRGEIGLRLFNPGSPASLDGISTLVLERRGKGASHALRGVRPFADGFLLTLAGVTSREQAAVLTNSRVLIDRAALPAPGPGEYFVSDVPGCEVFTMEGTRLGVVRETFWNGAHDVMIVDDAPGAEGGGAAIERMIPLVPEFIRDVDAPGRTVKVDWHDS